MMEERVIEKKKEQHEKEGIGKRKEENEITREEKGKDNEEK